MLQLTSLVFKKLVGTLAWTAPRCIHSKFSNITPYFCKTEESVMRTWYNVDNLETFSVKLSRLISKFLNVTKSLNILQNFTTFLEVIFKQ